MTEISLGELFQRSDAYRSFRDHWCTPSRWAEAHLPHSVQARGDPLTRDETGRLNVWAWEKWCIEHLPQIRKVSNVWNEPDMLETLIAEPDQPLWEPIYNEAGRVPFLFGSAAHATLFRLRWG